MAELVEQRAGVVETSSAGLPGSGLEKFITLRMIGDLAGQLLLVAQRGHPGAAMLGLAGEIIPEEQPDMLAGGVLHLPGAHVGVIERHVHRRESQTEQPPRGLEGRLDHALELEIRLDLRLLQVVARLA